MQQILVLAPNHVHMITVTDENYQEVIEALADYAEPLLGDDFQRALYDLTDALNDVHEEAADDA